MLISAKTFTVHKKFPLTISRGTTAETTNIWIKIEAEAIEGWGEASPFSTGNYPQTTADLLTAYERIAAPLAKYNPWQRQAIELFLKEANVPTALQAAIDMALHDWLGKKIGLPLWKMWGFDRDQIPPTSVTIGINSIEGVKQRVKDWLGLTQVQIFKVKLGSKDGIEADRSILNTVKETAPNDAIIYVDANGGWSLKEAIIMCQWLAELGIKYVEQPLAKTDNLANFATLYAQSPLPIFADESCFNSQDIYKLSGCVHGINIKLMKAGGLSEALRMVHSAKACGLQIMFGCYSDSSLANSAAAQLAPLADYLDLDSHLNLIDDPFLGVRLNKGKLLLNDLPGLGVSLI